MPTAAPADPVPYDFRRPSKVNREHIRSLQSAAETFARQCGSLLSTTLRVPTHVVAAGAQQETFDEWIAEIRTPTYLAVVALEPLPGAVLLHLPLASAMTIIDRLLGGPGTGVTPLRPLTEIERRLLASLVERMLRELAYALEPLEHVTPRLANQETNPQFTQIAAPSDMVAVLPFDVRMGDQPAPFDVCLPFATLKPVLDRLDDEATIAGRGGGDTTLVRQAMAERLAEAPVEIRVRFDVVQLPSADIVQLRAGDVLPLLHPVGAPLTVSVGGLDRFSAMPGRRGKRLACVLVDQGEEPR